MALDFPANPTDGQIYGSYRYSSAVGAWQGIEEQPPLTISSPVAPTAASPGDLWYNTSNGILFHYYFDGTSSQWVEVLSSNTLDISGKANLAGGNSFTGVQTFGTPIAVGSGGTGASDTTTARANLGAAASVHSHLGLIGQTIVANKTDQYTTTSAAWVAIPGLSISITPTSSSSKIIITAHVNISLSGAGGDAFVRLMTNAGPIGNGAGGYFGQVAGQDYFQSDTKSISYLHSPSTTSAHSYWIEFLRGSNTGYVNGRGYDGSFVTSSQIMVQEWLQA